MLIVYYRYTAGDKNSHRPVWFSKKLCLKSFLNACQKFNAKFHKSLNIIFAIDQDWNLSAKEKIFLKKYCSKQFTKNILLKTNNNTLSYRKVYEMSIKKKPQDIILFAEDDYYWRPQALIEMYIAIKKLSCDYITPYDHPVRYNWNFHVSPDVPHWENKIFCTGSWHFRSQESTCMTFMSKVKILKKDKNIHFLFSTKDKKCPDDRELFRYLQGLGVYKKKVKKKRLLLGPIPSLATHAHKLFLAPAVDWENEIKLINNDKKLFAC